MGDNGPCVLRSSLFNRPKYRGPARQHDALFAVLLAIVILGERIRGPQLLALAAIVVGITLMYRGQVGLSRRSIVEIEEVFAPVRTIV